MTILIRPEEFEADLGPNWRNGMLIKPSIDYATNSIHSWIGDEEVIVFRFKNYGFINDNRFNTYDISVGSAGIMIEIRKTI
jgi:hypothetical protein